MDLDSARPFSFLSVYDPPVPPFWQWTTKLSLLGPRVMGFFLDVMKNTYKAKAVTEFRDELGLRRLRQSDVRRPALAGTRAGIVLESVRQRQPDWPPQTEITGFCFYDGNHDSPIPPRAISFLDNGPPPIVFTLGSSAVWVARDFFRESIRGCKAVWANVPCC